jgi:hypothetical protein
MQTMLQHSLFILQAHNNTNYTSNTTNTNNTTTQTAHTHNTHNTHNTHSLVLSHSLCLRMTLSGTLLLRGSDT